MGYNYRQQPYPNWSGAQPVAAPLPVIRPVTSLEEVRASPIDFDGSVFYFTDMANKRIYTKQVGMDGSAIINLYEQKDLSSASSLGATYVTKEEFEATIQQIVEKIKANNGEVAKKPLFEI